MGGEGVTAIEWAERAEPLLPARTVRVRIEGAGDEPRTVQIGGASGAGWPPARFLPAGRAP